MLFDCRRSDTFARTEIDSNIFTAKQKKIKSKGKNRHTAQFLLSKHFLAKTYCDSFAHGAIKNFVNDLQLGVIHFRTFCMHWTKQQYYNCSFIFDADTLANVRHTIALKHFSFFPTVFSSSSFPILRWSASNFLLLFIRDTK